MLTALTIALWLPAAAPQLQVYFQSNLNDVAYQQKAFKKVVLSWKPPTKQPPAVGHKVVVQAVINREGKLDSAKLGMLSGSKAWDDAALAAVKKAAPFPPLPKSFTPTTVEVHFHFSWR